ncbi:MAG: hypothetical protein NT140_12250 [Deltaproteobacteria bacterium]|nr:hypothetical protein [Deltaproteobacteria bacterium]
MGKLKEVILVLVVLVLTSAIAHAAEKCVNTQGEALIIKSDVPSAKMEAVARAKWAAIEQVVGTAVKAQSFVQNFILVEDVMKTQVAGVVRSYKVLNEASKGETLTVNINACVEPAKAEQAVSSLALNSSVALFIPARKPRAGRGVDEYQETNILSETLIDKIIGQGYTVTDVAPTQTMDAAEIERAVKSGSTLAVRSMMYKFLSNIIIIGSIDYTVSTRKGEDIGYGIAMPFNNVTVRLNYRIVAKSSKTGNMEIITSGVEEGKGLAGNVEDATAKGMTSLTEKVTPKILDKLAQFTQSNVKSIRVKVAGVTDSDTNMDIKSLLQNIVWVSGVEETGMGEFTVKYPENTLYLANSIKQKGNFTVSNFSPYSLTVSYQK